MLTITFVGPDTAQSIVKINEDTTAGDVATSKYHLYWRTVKRNGIRVVPFTTRVTDGDLITVESE